MKKQLLTNSRAASFKSCRKKHWYEYEIGLRKRVDAKALRMGSAGHEALDVYKKTKNVEMAIDEVRKYYANCPAAFDAYDWEIEQTTIETLVIGYCWRWSDQTFEIVASEQSFQLPLKNPETGGTSPIWDMAGKIDGVILDGGRKLVLEHKFIGASLDQTGDYWRRLQLDAQISIYSWAARELGHDVSGVLYDVIRKPTIRPEQVPILDGDGLKIVLDGSGDRVMKKDGSPRQTGDKAKGYILKSRPMTPEEWGSKLLADIVNRHEFYFARVEIARLDSDIEEMRDEIWEIQQTIRTAQKTGRWYKTVARDTCTFCAFFGLCSSRTQLADGEIPEGFALLDSVHPELEDHNNANTGTATEF